MVRRVFFNSELKSARSNMIFASQVPPAIGNPDRETVVAAFGDMGNVEADGGFHHSWDFNNKGEVPSLNTTKALQGDDLSEFVLHIGDISYAVGYMSEWDRFMTQIEPVASRRAWMTGIGNHEQDGQGRCLSQERIPVANVVCRTMHTFLLHLKIR